MNKRHARTPCPEHPYAPLSRNGCVMCAGAQAALRDRQRTDKPRPNQFVARSSKLRRMLGLEPAAAE